jgi:hypothetical protein
MPLIPKLISISIKIIEAKFTPVNQNSPELNLWFQNKAFALRPDGVSKEPIQIIAKTKAGQIVKKIQQPFIASLIGYPGSINEEFKCEIELNFGSFGGATFAAGYYNNGQIDKNIEPQTILNYIEFNGEWGWVNIRFSINPNSGA